MFSQVGCRVDSGFITIRKPNGTDYDLEGIIAVAQPKCQSLLLWM